MAYYKKLYQSFSDAQINEDIHVTLEHLAKILDCSKQNGRILLKHMMDKGWVHWKSGLGRGNVSVLRLQQNWDRIVYSDAMDYIQQGKLEIALQKIQALSIEYKEQFIRSVYDQLGYQVEIHKDREVDVLRITTGSTFRTLDPAFVYLAKDYNMVKEIFDCLVRVNVDTQDIEPHLAHYWESDELGLQWTFYLRKHVFFHHGRELTAQDIVYTFQRLLNPLIGSPYRWMFSEIREIKQVGEHVVQFTLNTPNHYFLRYLSLPPASILPIDYYQNPKADISRFPLGTGPFKVIQNDQVMFVLNAFISYFKGSPHLDRIEMWILPEVTLTLEDDQKEGESTSFHQESAKTMRQYLSFNLSKNGPLQNHELRETIYRVIDRNKMIFELGGNRCITNGFFANTNVNAASVHNEKDSHLKNCGYGGEHIILYTFNRRELLEDAYWIQTKCREAGINIEVRTLPTRLLLQSEAIKEADLLLKGDFQEYDEELNFLKLIMHDQSVIKLHMDIETLNKVEDLYSVIMAEHNREKRIQMLKDINHHLITHLSVLYLYDERQIVQYPSYLKGITKHANGLVDFHTLWFKKND